MIKLKRALYWHDPVFGKDEEQQDIDLQILWPCEKKGIEVEKLETTDIPPIHDNEMSKDFDTLFFDWGGMSLGNSLMEHFCRDILSHAQDHPSKSYVMVSSFTEAAMKEAIAYFDKDKPFNIFLNIDSFAKYLKENSQ